MLSSPHLIHQCTDLKLQLSRRAATRILSFVIRSCRICPSGTKTHTQLHVFSLFSLLIYKWNPCRKESAWPLMLRTLRGVCVCVCAPVFTPHGEMTQTFTANSECEKARLSSSATGKIIREICWFSSEAWITTLAGLVKRHFTHIHCDTKRVSFSKVWDSRDTFIITVNICTCWQFRKATYSTFSLRPNSISHFYPYPLAREAASQVVVKIYPYKVGHSFNNTLHVISDLQWFT